MPDRPDATPPTTPPPTPPPATRRRSRTAFRAPSGAGLWVFGYGSLMWAPGFSYAEARPALLYGWHRALCILSIRNRGTVDCPGLALGLDRGGACRGVAFRIAPAEEQAALAYLWNREMSHGVYTPLTLTVRLEDSRRVSALTFVARPDHPQYIRGLTTGQAATLVRQGRGEYGTALDYLRNAVAHLVAAGIRDGPLHAVLDAAEHAPDEENAPAVNRPRLLNTAARREDHD